MPALIVRHKLGWCILCILCTQVSLTPQAKVNGICPLNCLNDRRGRLWARRDCTIQNTPVYTHFHINYIIQEEGVRSRSALSLMKRPYGMSACSGVPPSQSRRAHPRGEPQHGHPVRCSELQSLVPVGPVLNAYCAALSCASAAEPSFTGVGALQYGGSFPIGCGLAVNPRVAHIAAGQARAEAPANSLIKVDVDADTNPRDLDPDKLNLYDLFDDLFDTNDGRTAREKGVFAFALVVANSIRTPCHILLCAIEAVPKVTPQHILFLCFPGEYSTASENTTTSRRSEHVSSRLTRPSCGNVPPSSTIEVELLYVDQRWCTIRARHLPAEKCADTRNKGVRGCCWMKEPPIAPAFMSCCFSKELGAASEMAPTCQRTSLAQERPKRLPVPAHVRLSKRVRGMPTFLMVIKTVPPDTRPSKEPPGIVSCPSIETCRHQTDFHYGYQNVSQDPKSFDLNNAAFRRYWPLRSPPYVGVHFSKRAHAMPSFLVAIRIEHKANKSLLLPLGIRLTKPVPTGVNAADAHQRCSWNITHQPKENYLIKGLSSSRLQWYGACHKKRVRTALVQSAQNTLQSLRES
ncbi:hypothetical protein B0H17DRAFT_1140342 [Mycena rosella]|uniref:Uncharacterized protein n=1 Tax=Mycena rosella TaxID=1033263 RepID=A0AAD7D2N9_MYCRO|nr:hypothetical protein B0H17DRAFT_1140342 [Mycena rosella]